VPSSIGSECSSPELTSASAILNLSRAVSCSKAVGALSRTGVVRLSSSVVVDGRARSRRKVSLRGASAVGSPVLSNARVSLQLLVQQLLLGRTEDMSGPQLAAFVDGWTSLLELLRRSAVCVPDGSDEVRDALRRLVDEIERAQRRALGEE
jgi:hypothetical protein